MPAVEELVKSISELKDEEKNELLLEVFSGSSVLWLNNFLKSFEDKFGVTAAMPVAAAGPAGAAAPAAEAEEKTTFDVVLKEIGANKIQVIKVVRAATNLGLKESKAMVDGAPQPVKTGIPKEEADKLKKDFEAAGAKVEIK